MNCQSSVAFHVTAMAEAGETLLMSYMAKAPALALTN